MFSVSTPRKLGKLDPAADRNVPDLNILIKYKQIGDFSCLDRAGFSVNSKQLCRRQRHHTDDVRKRCTCQTAEGPNQHIRRCDASGKGTAIQELCNAVFLDARNAAE